MKPYYEAQLINALKQRYKDHIFASQVKLGSAGSKIIDAVAIKPTWSPITVIGHEIKVSRADFLSDNKYPEYMKACTNFYFVVPPDIVKDNEIPADVGLMIYSPKTGSLRVKKKAPYLKNEVKSEMLLHIMFWKMAEYNRPKSKEEHLADIRASVESDKYGHEIARKIAKLESQLEMNESRDHWNRFQKDFHARFGFYPNIWSVMDYIPDDINAVKDLVAARRKVEELHNLLCKKDEE